MKARLLALAVITLCGLGLLLLRSAQQPPATDADERAGKPVETVAKRLPEPGAQPAARPAAAPATAGHESTVESEPGIDLEGWVGDADGSGIGGIEIEIESHGFDAEGTGIQRTRSDGTGSFRLLAIVPGRQYRLEIRPQGDYAAFSLDSFTTGDGQTLRRILLQRVELVDTDGMIVDTGHAPVPDFELSVRSLAAEFPDRVIRSDSSGYFRLPAFPAGELRIASNAPDYYRIKGIELRPDEYRNLTLMIDRGNHHLSGWVGDENGAPLADATVTLKSAFTIDGYHSFSYRSIVTDANGGFEFSGLGGHRLTLGVYARGYESLIRRHDFESFADRIEFRLRRQERPQSDHDQSQ